MTAASTRKSAKQRRRPKTRVDSKVATARLKGGGSKAAGNVTKEAEETLNAIRAGQIDALVIGDDGSEKLYAVRTFAEIEQTQAALEKAGAERKQTYLQLQALAEERERLFQDMHDGCIHSIYAVGLNLEASLRLIEKSPTEARHIIADATANLNLVIQELRAFIAGHRLQIGVGRDLRTEIQKAARAAANRGLTFAIDIDDPVVRSLTSEQALHLLQIAREGISNSMRHANARTGLISLKIQNGKVRFELKDDGTGFVAAKQNRLGLGLHHIDARARKMGGEAHVSSTRNRGTRIVVEFKPR